LEAQEADVNPFQRYEHWDRRYGPHMRNLWLFLISLILLSVVLSQNGTIDRLDRVAAANCDALKVLIEGQQASQSARTLRLLGPLFENASPGALEQLLAESRARTERLNEARDGLACANGEVP
jgi:hypothetical protein